jgi:hypothetical protein
MTSGKGRLVIGTGLLLAAASTVKLLACEDIANWAFIAVCLIGVAPAARRALSALQAGTPFTIEQRPARSLAQPAPARLAPTVPAAAFTGTEFARILRHNSSRLGGRECSLQRLRPVLRGDPHPGQGHGWYRYPMLATFEVSR